MKRTEKVERINNWFKTTILALIILVLFFVFVTQATEIKKYTDARTEYYQLQEKAVTKGEKEMSESDTESPVGLLTTEPELPVIDFASLREINSDIIGWIYIPKVEISYPVVISKDNQDYVNMTFQKTPSKAGCIFADCRTENPFYQKTILYGHNMKDGSMFKKIYKLLPDDTVYVFLPSGYHVTYNVTGTQYVNADDSIYDIEILKDKEKLLLSTCAEGDIRFVVTAIKN